MRKANVRILTGQFVRRFFESDLVVGGEDMVTAVVRALATVITPGLMFAFWLQNEYPRRTFWGRIEDEYFFVLFSFVTMAGVAVFEWEMLFPDRLDFLVLTPLSLRKWELPAAKAIALALFLGLFLGATNLFGTLMLPGIVDSGFHRTAGHTGGHLLNQMGAHAAATLSAGIFGALLIILLGGVLLCVLPTTMFQNLSLVFRMLAVTALGLLLIDYARFGDSLQQTVDRGARMRWDPTLWFLGMYQVLQHGTAAPAFAHEAASRAEKMLVLVVCGVAAVYPLAWIRMRRMSMEQQANGGAKHGGRMRRAVDALARSGEERAVFHFIGQTMGRNSRYQVYMAIYFGAGLALAISCATGVRVRNGMAAPTLSAFGLHAVMPLLVFWTIAGLKMAFALPLQLEAGWVFRTTGAALTRCVVGVRKWAFVCGLTVVAAVTAALACAGWGARELVAQMVCGVCLCALLVDGFFFMQARVPFTRPRQPGRSSLPLVLTLYVGVLTPFVYGMIFLELRMERSVLLLIAAAVTMTALHWPLQRLRERMVLIEEEREGGDGEIQLLGLCGELSS